MSADGPALPAPCGQVLQSSFRPHPLLAGPHLQTIAAQLRPKPRLALRIERLDLPDGDFIDLAWSGEHNAGGPIATLIHGLAGGFESHYLRGTAQQLTARGWRTVIMQLRGAGPEPNRLPRQYNQDDTEDVRGVWHLLRVREPHAFIASVGWSLGANLILKALAEEGDSAPVDIAAAAGAPFAIRPCAERMRSGFSRIYQMYLLHLVKLSLLRKNAVVPLTAAVDLDAAVAAPDFIKYDDVCTAPLAGFPDADAYYRHASCGPWLKRIRRPTLVVHALDDPFMVAEIVPRADALSPCVTLEIAHSGGHVGFIGSRSWGQPYFWLEERLADYVHAGLLAGPDRVRGGGCATDAPERSGRPEWLRRTTGTVSQVSPDPSRIPPPAL